MIKKLFFALVASLSAMASYGQDVTLSGTVTDVNGKAVPGAIVIEKGTNNAVKTASDGSYSLTIPSKRVPTSVLIRLVGMGSSEVAIDGTSNTVTHSPSLGAQTKSLNEVVVSASKKSEKILNAPASVSIISEARIQQNTALSVVDNVRKVAAVDVMPTGLVSNNVVIRGFNNIFSGQTMFLVDNRIASVPSLRVNAFQLVPTSNSDVRSMEIVRGPASALYGPFASNGVMAVYTKSPLDMENRMEVTLGLTSGLRAGDDNMPAYGFVADNSIEKLGILNPEIRIAGKLSKTLGIKVSGNYLKATDFAFFDSREPNGRVSKFGNQSGGNAFVSDGSAPFIFNRDFSIKKISGEAKVDWRPAPQTELSFSTGYANNTNVELTGLGGAQAVGWTSNYFQTQFKKDRFYAQYYVNSTNSGNTYLIPQNVAATDTAKITYLKENSSLHSLQLQHSSKALNNNLNLVYGYDMYMTRPSGNVYGRFDGNKSNINQYGGYLQGEYKFTPKWSATAAARVDYQDAINEWMFSPRAAVVFKPKDNHTFRATYNRSFASPTALNFYLDLNNASNSLFPGQSIRGFGNATGMMYNYDANGIAMYNNAANVSTSLSTPIASTYVTRYAAALRSVGVPASQANFVANAFLNGMTNANAALTPVDLVAFSSDYSARVLAASTAAGRALTATERAALISPSINASKLDASKIVNRESVKSTVTQTAEIGYKGLVTDKLALGLDLYYTRIDNFVSPLTTASYAVMIDPAKLEANATAALAAAGYPSNLMDLNRDGSSQSELTALYLLGNQTTQVGTIAPNNTISGNDIILTYLNLGMVDVAGLDLSFNYAATKSFTIEGAFSHVNKDRIPLQGAAGGFVSLNAPKFKSALSMSYKLPIDHDGVTLTGAWRWMDKFDANSGVYVGRVNAMNMLDLGLAWKPSASPNTTIALNINNLLDHRHAFFPLSSPMGRVAMLKLLHTFGVR